MRETQNFTFALSFNGARALCRAFLSFRGHTSACQHAKRRNVVRKQCSTLDNTSRVITLVRTSTFAKPAELMPGLCAREVLVVRFALSLKLDSSEMCGKRSSANCRHLDASIQECWVQFF